MNKFVCLLVSVALAAPLVSADDQCAPLCKQSCSTADALCVDIPGVLDCAKQLTACNGICDSFCSCNAKCMGDCGTKASGCAGGNPVADVACMTAKVACESKCPATCAIPITQQVASGAIKQALQSLSGLTHMIQAQIKKLVPTQGATSGATSGATNAPTNAPTTTTTTTT